MDSSLGGEHEPFATALVIAIGNALQLRPSEGQIVVGSSVIFGISSVVLQHHVRRGRVTKGHIAEAILEIQIGERPRSRGSWSGASPGACGGWRRWCGDTGR